MLHLLAADNRAYYLDADKTRIIENNADYQVVDIETVQHGDGQVIDLSDEEDRNEYAGAAA